MTVDLEEAMMTQRAIRRLRPDPVDDELILKILRLAVKAPTGSNQQNWEFVVVRDPKVKAALGKQNRRVASPYLKAGKIVKRRDEKSLRLIKAVQWQLEHWDEIPVIMVPCLRGISWPLPWIYKSSRYGSIYPAIQNLLLAARGRPRRGADDVPALEPRCRAPDLAASVARRADRVHPDGLADGEVRTDDAHTCRRADTSRSLRESRLQSLSVSIPSRIVRL